MKKILALVLTAVLMLSLLPMAAAETADWEPFAENVSITIPVYDRGQAGVPNVEDNYWTKWIQENFGDRYNITVNYTRTDVEVVVGDVTVTPWNNGGDSNIDIYD